MYFFGKSSAPGTEISRTWYSGVGLQVAMGPYEVGI
jgi:hypothetical protein